MPCCPTTQEFASAASGVLCLLAVLVTPIAAGIPEQRPLDACGREALPVGSQGSSPATAAENCVERRLAINELCELWPMFGKLVQRPRVGQPQMSRAAANMPDQGKILPAEWTMASVSANGLSHRGQ